MPLKSWPNWDTFTTAIDFAHSTYRDIVGCEAKEVCALDRDEQAGGDVVVNTPGIIVHGNVRLVGAGDSDAGREGQ